MSNWTQGDVTTDGVRIHYYRTGNGSKPAMVLCHGFSDSGLCWTPVARELEGDHDIVMIDARGHGLSDCPDADHGPHAMAHDVANVIRGLGLDRPVAMGHSMGGATVMELIVNYPELVRRAIMEDSGPRDLPQPFYTPEGLAQRIEHIAFYKSHTKADLIAYGRNRSPLWQDAEWEPWADAKLQMNIEMVSRGRGRRANWREMMPRVQCPLLILRADNDKGAGVTAADADAAQAMNELIQVVYVPGAGHNIRREAFAGFMRAVRRFLACD